jgi:hypothetical protein
MLRFFRHSELAIAFCFAASVARACDLCGRYTPQMEAMPDSELFVFGESLPGGGSHDRWLSRVYVAIAEQFTHFGTLQLDGAEVDNPTGQYLDSSITQFVAGYSFNLRFALQINARLSTARSSGPKISLSIAGPSQASAIFRSSANSSCSNTSPADIIR